MAAGVEALGWGPSDRSKSMKLALKPRVFQVPKARPIAIQTRPRITAWLARFHQSSRHTKKPAVGISRLITFFEGARQKNRMNAAAFTPMKAVSAPKLSRLEAS